ncbi:TIGR01841 family phasin [Pikeienuella sp. HZG-20]|uniref:phasin family protein n=1 Tax=Paludibacillus litoralis TaxID=3133267 RepID=UPI0030EDA5BC
MFGSGANPFDLKMYADMFKSMDMTKIFDPSAMKGFDQSALYEAQRKNMDALVAAQKAAASGYQDLFEKQVKIFQETMQAAQAQLAEMTRSDPGPETAAKQTEFTSKAFESAVANARDLAEAAKRTNVETYEIVRARIEENMKDLAASMR